MKRSLLVVGLGAGFATSTAMRSNIAIPAGTLTLRLGVHDASTLTTESIEYDNVKVERL